MAKDWTQIYSNGIEDKQSIQEKKRMDKKRNLLIRNTKTLTVEQLKKEGDTLYAQKMAEEDRLIQLVSDGKVTKKNLVEKVALIKADREKKKNKNKPQKETNA